MKTPIHVGEYYTESGRKPERCDALAYEDGAVARAISICRRPLMVVVFN